MSCSESPAAGSTHVPPMNSFQAFNAVAIRASSNRGRTPAGPALGPKYAESLGSGTTRAAHGEGAIRVCYGGRMTRSVVEDAFAHHVWATLRLVDTCLPL